MSKKHYVNGCGINVREVSLPRQGVVRPKKGLLFPLVLVFALLLFSGAPSYCYASDTGNNFITEPATPHQQIGDLKIGDRVVDKSWSWTHKPGENYSDDRGNNGIDKPVTWIVVAKEHYGLESGVTLLSEEIIGKYTFDNSTHIHAHGSSHWGNSGTHNSSTYGIRPWLNSYCDNGSYAENSNINCPEGGFYNAFPEQFRNAILTTRVPCKENNVYYNGSDYISNDKVFLPSERELNGWDRNAHEDESVWPYFKDVENKDRIAKLDGSDTMYWTRSPSVDYSYLSRQIHSNGVMNFRQPFNAHCGVRPALNMANSTPVSVFKNDNGAFEFLNSGITIPEDAVVFPTETTYALNSGENIDITLTLKGKTLKNILSGNDKLTENTDYIIKNNTCTILATYLENREEGEVHLTFEMDDGASPTVIITIVAFNILHNYILNSSDNIEITLPLNDRTLEKVRFGKDELVENKDYIVEGEICIIFADYLNSRGAGEITLTFEMCAGFSSTIILTIAFQPGDVSGSGDVSVSDAILVLRHIVGLTNLKDPKLYDEDAFLRARVGGEENLTVSDAILILRYIVGLIDNFSY